MIQTFIATKKYTCLTVPIQASSGSYDLLSALVNARIAALSGVPPDWEIIRVDLTPAAAVTLTGVDFGDTITFTGTKRLDVLRVLDQVGLRSAGSSTTCIIEIYWNHRQSR